MTEHLLQLPDRDLRDIADAIRANRLTAPVTAVGLQRLLAPSVAGPVAGDLQQLIQNGFAPQHVATVLELLIKDRNQRPSLKESLELVTTGPEANDATSRDTSVVVRELFVHAEKSVLVAGYAVYQGQRVFRALADRMQQVQGLRVRMFLDIQRAYGDTTLASLIVRRFAERFRTEQWPADRPLPDVYYDPRSLNVDMERRACLHAKCVVVDRQHVFASSANFTEAAQERNIEVGLLVRSRRLAEQLTNHFDALLGAGLLEQAF